jgi:hypothetical protein|tara:strand:+ start:188 stop:400 length:213 start_codon:yes stop_codon:yes gene_type:complete
MTLQRIIEELENIIEQSADDELIEKDAIMEALIDVVRNAKGDSLDFDMEDDDHFSSWQETDFSSLADLDN